MTERPIFLDYHAHGPLDPQVAEALSQAFLDVDANPHSGSIAGDAARVAVETARAEVGCLLGVSSSGLVFTSGATEANNLAFAGIATALWRAGRRRILVSAVEHPSVLRAAEAVGDRFEVKVIPVTSQGLIDLDAFEALLTPDTGLVSVAAANHEIGVLQDLPRIAALSRRAGAYVHSDLAQAAGKVAIDLSEIDLASVSAHKLHGPFGVGALYMRRGIQKSMAPLLRGGGQERGFRSGTVPAPLCVGFGRAAIIAAQARSQEGARVLELRTRLWGHLNSAGGVTLNGDMTRRLPGNLNLCIAGVDAEALVMRLRHEVVLSTGSACTTSALDPSPVLIALGLARPLAETAIRIGLGRFTTEPEIDRAASIILKAVADLRAVSQRAVA